MFIPLWLIIVLVLFIPGVLEAAISISMLLGLGALMLGILGGVVVGALMLCGAL